MKKIVLLIFGIVIFQEMFGMDWPKRDTERVESAPDLREPSAFVSSSAGERFRDELKDALVADVAKREECDEELSTLLALFIDQRKKVRELKEVFSPSESAENLSGSTDSLE